MKPALVFASLLSASLVLLGCGKQWRLGVTVQDPADTQVKGATLTITECTAEHDALVGLSSTTANNGQANIHQTGEEFPTCSIVVSKSGYETYRATFAELCGGEVNKDCYRDMDISVVLKPLEDAPTSNDNAATPLPASF